MNSSPLQPDMAAVADETLVARVAERDTAAFEAVYDRYGRLVYSLCAYMLGREEAEEAAQEVFLKLWERAGQFDHRRGEFRHWFMAITRHSCLSRLRKRSLKRRVEVTEEAEAVLETAADPAPGAEEAVLLRDEGRRALKLVMRLPADQRKLLMLAYFGGLSHSEIADALGLPLGTVKTRIRRALERLRGQFEVSDVAGEPERDATGKEMTRGTQNAV